MPGASWGSLPTHLQQEWETMDCDSYSIVPSADCTPSTGTILVATTDARRRASMPDCIPPYSEAYSSRPSLISVLAGVSTRHVQWSGPKDLALFRVREDSATRSIGIKTVPFTPVVASVLYPRKFLLPSVVRTVECGFDYNVVLGYDLGDHFYDTNKGRTYLKTWFEVSKLSFFHRHPFAHNQTARAKCPTSNYHPPATSNMCISGWHTWASVRTSCWWQ